MARDGSEIVIYTDGGAIGNPGPGGFGVVAEIDGQEKTLARGYRATTNNRMELMGVIAGLVSTDRYASGKHTVVVSDSRYVVDAMEKGWARRWRANDWRRNNKGDIALNSDLWERLLEATDGRSVSFEWVKGHSGHPQNERCDALVREASALPVEQQLVDEGYEGNGAQRGAPSFFEPTPDDVAPSFTRDTTEVDAPALSHVDESGEAQMVNVGGKEITDRVASASCDVLMSSSTLELIRKGEIAKGDVISTAKLAGIMGAKRTAELIPMCHNLPISQVELDVDYLEGDAGLRIDSTVRTTWRTGVEMEAMTAASIAALTIYDMCKSAERTVCITNLRLTHKSGGKSGPFNAE